MGKGGKKHNKAVRKEEAAVLPEDNLRTIVFAIIAAVGLVVYFNTFRNGFVWDDIFIVKQNEFIRNWGHLKDIFTTDVHHFGDKSNFYRPLQTLTYLFDHTLWKLNPAGYHITNALLHIFNACVIYAFIFYMSGIIEDYPPERLRRISLAAALLWLVHPIHTQCTSYISGRGDILATGFILLAVYTYAKMRNAFLPVIFFILALISKEMAVITPLLIALVYYIRKKYARKFREGSVPEKSSYSILPYIVIAVIFIILRLTVIYFPDAPFIKALAGLPSRIFTSIRATVILIGLLIWPFGLSMVRNIRWEPSFFDPKVVLSFISLAAICAYALYVRRKSGLILFGIAWFFIAYLPEANIIPINANLSEHWMYLPSIGFFLVLSLFLVGRPISGNYKIGTALAAALIIFYGGLTMARNYDWKDEISLFKKTLAVSPNSARVHYNLGNTYAAREEYDRALEEFKIAVELDPEYAEVYGNIGLIYFRRGKTDDAIALYEKANSLRDDLVENHNNLGLAYDTKGLLGKAKKEYEKTLKMKPDHDGALVGLGIIYAKMGDTERAEALFKKTIEVNPNNPDAAKNLAYLQGLKKSVKK